MNRRQLQKLDKARKAQQEQLNETRKARSADVGEVTVMQAELKRQFVADIPACFTFSYKAYFKKVAEEIEEEERERAKRSGNMAYLPGFMGYEHIYIPPIIIKNPHYCKQEKKIRK